MEITNRINFSSMLASGSGRMKPLMIGRKVSMAADCLMLKRVALTTVRNELHDESSEPQTKIALTFEQIIG